MIPARPTTYKGIRMRSRLEADYAAYLDRQDCPWEYEPECFASPEGQWLPDFRGGQDRALIELKPAAYLFDHLGEGEIGPAVKRIDSYLKRMTIAWASKPDASLQLVLWDYGATEERLIIMAEYRGEPWLAFPAGCEVPLLWPGMGQYQQITGSANQRDTRPVPPVTRLTQLDIGLEDRWPGLVGPLAEHTVPGELKGGEFTIFADSTTWATQTRLLSAHLIRTLNLPGVFGPGAVSKIKVRRGTGG
jgi:hypothetical protein